MIESELRAKAAALRRVMVLNDPGFERDAFQISLHDLTVAEAETAIARLWLILTEHSIPTPLLLVESAPGGRITLSTHFVDAAATAIACRAFRDIPRKARA